jgi:hypothetical protein
MNGAIERPLVNETCKTLAIQKTLPLCGVCCRSLGWMLDQLAVPRQALEDISHPNNAAIMMILLQNSLMTGSACDAKTRMPVDCMNSCSR